MRIGQVVFKELSLRGGERSSSYLRMVLVYLKVKVDKWLRICSGQ